MTQLVNVAACRALTRKRLPRIVFDYLKVGDVSGWLRSSALAGQHGLRLSGHIFKEFSAHLLAVTPHYHLII